MEKLEKVNESLKKNLNKRDMGDFGGPEPTSTENAPPQSSSSDKAAA